MFRAVLLIAAIVGTARVVLACGGAGGYCEIQSGGNCCRGFSCRGPGVKTAENPDGTGQTCIRDGDHSGQSGEPCNDENQCLSSLFCNAQHFCEAYPTSACGVEQELLASVQAQSNVACELVVRPILETARDAVLWRYQQLVERPAHLQPMINRCSDSLRMVRTPPAGTDWRTDVAELRDWNEAAKAEIAGLKKLWLALDRAGAAPCPAVAITACSRACSDNGQASACSQVTGHDDVGRDVSETQIDYDCARGGACRDSEGAPTQLAYALAHEAGHALLTSGGAPDSNDQQHTIMGWLTCLTGDAALQDVTPAFCDEYLANTSLGVLERHCVSCSPTCSDGSRR